MKVLSMNNWPTYSISCTPEKANSNLPDLIEKIKFGKVEPITTDLMIDSKDLVDVLYYLQKLKVISEEPELGEKPNYIPLDVIDLIGMIGDPVYVKEGEKGNWNILEAVKVEGDKTVWAYMKGEGWEMVNKNIYRTKEGAEDD